MFCTLFHLVPCQPGSYEVLGTLATTLTIGLGRASIQALRQHGLGVQGVQYLDLVLSEVLTPAGQLVRHCLPKSFTRLL